MDVLGSRVEKGQCKRKIKEDRALFARRTLENLLLDDYFQWLFWLVRCVETSPEEVGSYQEFCNNECLTKHEARRKQIQSNLQRKKVLKPEENLAEQKPVVMPKLEIEIPLLEDDTSLVYDEWQVEQTLEERRSEVFQNV